MNSENEKLREALRRISCLMADREARELEINGSQDRQMFVTIMNIADAALSQQADHFCRNCEGIQPESCMLAEPAPAQDEKAAFDDWYPLGCPGAGVTAQLSALAGFRAGADWQRTRPAQTAPQPEQSGLVEALEEIAAGEKTVWRDDHFEVENDMAIDYPGIAKAALDAYRAALSAQGGE